MSGAEGAAPASDAPADASAPLPSQAAADKLVRGESGGLAGVVLSTGLRAGLIGAGMYMCGARQNLVRNAVGGAVAIELFVLAWSAGTRKKAKPAGP